MKSQRPPEPLSYLMVVGTLCLIVLIVFIGLTIGLYHEEVDNKAIFAIFDGQLKTCVGGLIAVISFKLGMDKSK